MVQSAISPVSLARHPLYARGVQLYQAGEFFACHEVLEELWTPMRGPHRIFLQALIHFAVAMYHQQRSNRLGAQRQLRKALRKLEPYAPFYEGLETDALMAEGRAALDRIIADQGAEPPRMLLQSFLDG